MLGKLGVTLITHLLIFLIVGQLAVVSAKTSVPKVLGDQDQTVEASPTTEPSSSPTVSPSATPKAASNSATTIHNPLNIKGLDYGRFLMVVAGLGAGWFVLMYLLKRG